MKKLLAFTLTAVMALGMAVPAFAAGTPKITEVKHALGFGGVWEYRATVADLTEESISMADMLVQDKPEIGIALDLDMFTIENNGGTPPTTVTMKLLRDSKMTVKTSVKAGSKVIDSVKFDGNTDTEIRVKWVERFVSTKDIDYDLTVYLWLDGKRQDDYGVQIYGNYANRVIAVDEKDDYFDGTDGAVAEAMEFNKAIDFDLGKGVTIETKMFKGKKYYGQADRDEDEAADVVFKKYPDIDNVVTLYTVGLNQTGDRVKFNTDYTGYFVYDKDLNFLGMGTDKVPYSPKYYLANKKLNIATDSE